VKARVKTQPKIRPIIGVTVGEPSGIGPEVTAKALAIEEIHQLCRPVVFAPKQVFKKSLQVFGPNQRLKATALDELEDFDDENGEALALVDTTLPSAEESVLSSIQLCAEACLKGQVQGMVTGPVDKHRLNKAMKKGNLFLGHTEYLAKITRADRVAMMLAGETLRVVPVTTHCSIAEVSGQLTLKAIADAIELTALALKEWYGIGEPRIGVTALNPHGGEQGLFGNEEERVILPAVEKCRMNGIEVIGPLSADTLFYQAVRQRKFDAVVTMYHDQALIPLKLLHFQDAVNITLGLPIIRTSVDHGTAYDLVGKKQADPSSMIEAIHMAARLCRI
jgi:4-hydroxythreonine-4-phosphate dehydrogenase